MSHPIQVIQVIGRMNPGGVECWLMELLRRMDRSHFRFTFCPLRAEEGLYDKEIRTLGARVIACPIEHGMARFSQAFRAVLQETRCDVVHSHVLFFSGVVLRLAARAGVPIRIAHAHTTRDGRSDSLRRGVYRRLMRRQIRKHATHGIACAAGPADYLFRRDWRNRPKYRVMPCQIDPEVFRRRGDRATLCQTLGLDAEATIIGHVGSFREAKNHSFLIRIAADLMEADPRVRLLLVGDGPLRPAMEALARDLGIRERVTFAGVRDDVARLMTTLFDLFLFPSRFEGLGVTVVEAQCAAVPCLISQVVPSETTVIQELVFRESLTADRRVWAQRAREILRSPPFNPGEAVRRIESSEFNIAHGVALMSDLYRLGRRVAATMNP